MSQVEFAKHRGVTKGAVSNWKAKGLLIFSPGPGGKRMVEVAPSDQAINAAVDPMRGRPASGVALPLAPDAEPGPDSLTKVRTDLILEQTTRQRLQNDKLAGDLVPLAEFERQAGEAGRLARERMHAMARQLSERLAAETDPRAVTTLLTTSIDEAFETLASQIEAEAKAEADLDAAIAAAEDADDLADPDAEALEGVA